MGTSGFSDIHTCRTSNQRTFLVGKMVWKKKSYQKYDWNFVLFSIRKKYNSCYGIYHTILIQFFCTIFRVEKVRKSKSSFGTNIFRTILSSIQVWSNFIPFSVCLFLDWIFVQINGKKEKLNRHFWNKFFWVWYFVPIFWYENFAWQKYWK